MKYLSFGVVVISLAVSIGSAVAEECPKNLQTIEPGKLTMSINATIPPRQYIDDQGNLQGLHPDLGNEIAKRLSEKYRVFYFDNDVIKDDLIDNLQELNFISKLSNTILLVNCSRDEKKILSAKNIIESKKLKFIELNIWK